MKLITMTLRDDEVFRLAMYAFYAADRVKRSQEQISEEERERFAKDARRLGDKLIALSQ